jgi:V-type H+-transporting ATPase subunit a
LERTKGDDFVASENQNLGFVAGVIPRERIIGFERILWRVSRGNIYLRQADIAKPFKDPKSVRKIFSKNTLHEKYFENFNFLPSTKFALG